MISISVSSLISQLRETSGSVTVPARPYDPNRCAATPGMHPSSTSPTPFSVKDILKLEHHQEFGNEFMVSNQVFPMHCQPVHGASLDRGHIQNSQAEPCASGRQEKFDNHNSTAEEEIFEQGEVYMHTLCSCTHTILRFTHCGVGWSGLGRLTGRGLGRRGPTRPHALHIFFISSTFKHTIGVKFV